MGCRPPPESGGQPVTPRRLAVKALIHQEQAGYANLVLDAELKKCAPPLEGRDAAYVDHITDDLTGFLAAIRASS